MRIFALAASDNPESLNRKLLQNALDTAMAQGAEVRHEDYAPLTCIPYSDGMYEKKGLPKGAKLFEKHLEEADALMFAVPEYNWSYPGSFKNIIDWISRIQPGPLANKPCLLLSASPSLQGGIKGLIHLRVPLEALGVYVYPKMFALSNALQSLDGGGRITVPVVEDDLKQITVDFIDYATRLTAQASAL